MELKTYFAQDTAGNIVSTPLAILYLADGITPASGLLAANGAPLLNPFNGTPDGRVEFNAPVGDYILQVSGGSRVVRVPVTFVGDVVNQVDALATAAAASAAEAEGFADTAANSAASAAGFETPEFASQAAGEAGTSGGDVFRVPIGTTPETFNLYRNTGSGSALVSPLATTAALAASGGAALVRNVRSETNAVTRTVAAVLQERPLSLMDFYNNEADLSTAFTKLNAAILASGGNRRIVMPPSGAAYRTTVGLLVSVPRVTVDIHNDLTLTAKGNLIKFVGSGHSSIEAMLQKPILNLHGVTLDGGGSEVTGYTYATIDSEYNTVFFDACNDFELNGFGNSKISNGLVDCLKMRRPFRGHTAGFEAVGSVHDNCVSVVQNPSFVDAADPDTWPQVLVERFKTSGAKDVGFTAYNTIGVRFRNFESFGHGTDGALAQTLNPDGTANAGATGAGFSVEGDQTYRTHCVIEDGSVWDCFSAGGSVQMGGAFVRRVNVENINSSSSDIFQGHGLVVFAKAGFTDAIFEDVTVANATKAGIAAKSNSTKYTSLAIRGRSRSSSNGQEGVRMDGIVEAFVGPEVELSGNCTSSGLHELFINNNAANAGNGKARVHCNIVNAGKALSEIRSVGDAEFSHMTLDNAAPSATAALLLIAGTTAIDRAAIQHNKVINSSTAPTYIGRVTGTVGITEVGGNLGDQSAGVVVDTSTATVTTKRGLVAQSLTDPAALTYSAPAGGVTVDAEARTAIGQNAADIAEVRTHLISLQTALRQSGGAGA